MEPLVGFFNKNHFLNICYLHFLRGRGRPKLTWVEAIKGDLKGWNIPKDLALDRSAWKTTIHVPEP